MKTAAAPVISKFTLESSCTAAIGRSQCRFLGERMGNKVCLKLVPHLGLLVDELATTYTKLSKDLDKDIPCGNNCGGVNPTEEKETDSNYPEHG